MFISRLFEPTSMIPFKLSRSKLDLFLQCPRCFYLDRRLGVLRPALPGFTLNSAVDVLLKKEFDLHRAAKSRHPLMEHYKINAVPLAHEKIDQWRNNFVGIQHLHKPTNFLIFGAIDDLWIDAKSELMVVDYKSTSTQEEISLDGKYKEGYKRQMEIYQWLFRQNGFKVSKTGYFVYANASKDKKAFDGKLEFKVEIISYKADDSWVEKAIIEARKCLESEKIPAFSDHCDFCAYLQAIKKTAAYR